MLDISKRVESVAGSAGMASVGSGASGYRNVCWGSDYPHLEGTFGHTQQTLHKLVGDLTPEQRYRITQGTFEELFPHVPPAPPDGADSVDHDGS
jgi:hypothetical protein